MPANINIAGSFSANLLSSKNPSSSRVSPHTTKLGIFFSVMCYATKFFSRCEATPLPAEGLQPIDNWSPYHKVGGAFSDALAKKASIEDEKLELVQATQDLTGMVHSTRKLLASTASCSTEPATMYSPVGSFGISSVAISNGIDTEIVGSKLLSVVGSSDDGLYITTSNLDGSSASTREIESAPSFIQPNVNPLILKSQTSDTSLVVYDQSDTFTGTDSKLRVSLVNSDGSQQVAPTTLSFIDDSFATLKPSACTLSSGGWAVARVTSDRVGIQIVNSNGSLGSVSESITVTHQSSLARESSIAQFNNGQFFLSYEDGGQVYVDRLNSDLSVSTSSLISSFSATVHTTLKHSDGHVVVCFRDSVGLKTFTIDYSGTKSAVQTLCSNSQVNQIRLAEAADGKVAVTFTHDNGGNEESAAIMCTSAGIPIGGDFQIGSGAGAQKDARGVFSGNDLITVFDNGGSLSGIRHLVNNAPIIANPIGSVETTVGTRLDYTVPADTANDEDPGQSVTYDVDGLPSWASWNGTAITGTPPNGSSGTSSNVQLRASDGLVTTSDNFTLSIPNLPPRFTSSFAAQNGQVDTPFSWELPMGVISDNDPGQLLSAFVRGAGSTALASWLAWNGTHLAGVPTPPTAGTTLSLEAVASDGLAETTTPLSLSIADRAPTFPLVVQRLSLSGTDEGFSYNLPANFTATDPDGQPVTYSLGTGAPENLIIVPESGALSGNIPAGNYTFNLIASSGNKQVAIPVDLVISETPNNGTRPYTGNPPTPPDIQFHPLTIVNAALGITLLLLRYGLITCVHKERRKQWKDTVVKKVCCKDTCASRAFGWIVGYIIDANGSTESSCCKCCKKRRGPIELVNLNDREVTSVEMTPQSQTSTQIMESKA